MAGNRFYILRAHNSRKVFKSACDRYDLVYFGHVSQHNDEHQMVRGFTLSPSHVDRHYCVGTVSGADIILLERMDTLSFPDRPSRAYTWTILQIDLSHRLPTHLLLNSQHYDDTLYRYLFAKFHDIRPYEARVFDGHDVKFAATFRVYAPTQHIDDVMTMLSPDTTAVLAHHFNIFDYEAYGDQLIVYAPTTSPSERTIEQMLKAGIWLARQLDPHPAETRTDDTTPRVP